MIRFEIDRCPECSEHPAAIMLRLRVRMPVRHNGDGGFDEDPLAPSRPLWDTKTVAATRTRLAEVLCPSGHSWLTSFQGAI